MSARTAAVACNHPASVIDLKGGKSNCQIARHNGFFRSQIMLLRFFQVHIQNPHSQGSDLKNCKLSAAAETDLILQTGPGTPRAGLGGIFLFHISGYALNRRVGQVPPWKRAEDKMDVTLPLTKSCSGCGRVEAARPGQDRPAAACHRRAGGAQPLGEAELLWDPAPGDIWVPAGPCCCREGNASPSV